MECPRSRSNLNGAFLSRISLLPAPGNIEGRIIKNAFGVIHHFLLDEGVQQRISLSNLCSGRVSLVRKIISTAILQCRVDQFSRELLCRARSLVRHLLVEIEHEGERISPRVALS